MSNDNRTYVSKKLWRNITLTTKGTAESLRISQGDYVFHMRKLIGTHRYTVSGQTGYTHDCAGIFDLNTWKMYDDITAVPVTVTDPSKEVTITIEDDMYLMCNFFTDVNKGTLHLENSSLPVIAIDKIN